MERRLEDSCVALQHLEMQLINVACDDPGVLIGGQLALPLLQERLDGRGLEAAAQRAKLAEDEVLRMEVSAGEKGRKGGREEGREEGRRGLSGRKGGGGAGARKV